MGDGEYMPGDPMPIGPALKEPEGVFKQDMHTFYGDGGGLRFNEGKPRFDLLPPEALVALAQHYGRGAAKYEARNWERGMDWCKCFASMERHAWAWMSGEDLDPETQSHHMIAVAWNAIALFVYATRNIGNDDRPSKQ
jgi:hypothetical protein